MLKRFPTPHEQRMAKAARSLPPKLDPIAAGALARRAEMDLELRARYKEFQERLPLSCCVARTAAQASACLEYFDISFRSTSIGLVFAALGSYQRHSMLSKRSFDSLLKT